MGLDFVAIDFETANQRRASVCAVGLVRVRNGKIVDSSGILVNPDCEFNYWNTAIHGITEKDVALAPTWKELWPEVREYIGRDVLFCHNSSFDMSVLRSALEEIGEEYTPVSVCTFLLSRSIWPGLETYKLNVLCKRCGIPLDHHNAKSDAEACALLAIELANSASLHTTDEILRFKLNPAALACSGTKKVFDDNVVTTKPILKGLNIAFTGGLNAMSRSKAEDIVERLGAYVAKSIYSGVNALIIGEQVSPKHVESHSKKLREMEKLQERGKPIVAIYEDEFLDLVKGNNVPQWIQNTWKKREEARNSVLRPEVREYLLTISDICKAYGEDNSIDGRLLKWQYSQTTVSVHYYYRVLDMLVQKKAVFLIMPRRLSEKAMDVFPMAPKSFGNSVKIEIHNADDLRKYKSAIGILFLDTVKKYKEVEKYIIGINNEYGQKFESLSNGTEDLM